MLVADIVQDAGELLNGADDDFLALLDETAQIARMLGVADGRARTRANCLMVLRIC
ncbi:MAG: hypothetical protein JO223_11520 [Hyphomicrobiales bacterium]|nr:hypothetical protein [Hyphomicrobiales bacterium]MBV8440384.1 hypothetical protein [Hyphomicrobiales bacterium]